MKWYLGGPSAYCLLEVVLTLEFAFVGVRLTRLRKTSIRRGLGQDRTRPAGDRGLRSITCFCFVVLRFTIPRSCSFEADSWYPPLLDRVALALCP